MGLDDDNDDGGSWARAKALDRPPEVESQAADSPRGHKGVTLDHHARRSARAQRRDLEPRSWDLICG